MLIKQFGESDHLSKKEFWVEDEKGKRTPITEMKLDKLYHHWSKNDIAYRADREGHIIYAYKEPIEIEL